MNCWAMNVDDSAQKSELLTQAYGYYEVVQSVCSDISDSLYSVSGIAKANTAINAIGTVASGGALGTGIAKDKVDSDVKKLMDEICSLGGCNEESIKSMSESTVEEVIQKFAKISDLQKQVQAETERSKKLGNWRTGLMSANVATNITSAILSGINRDKSELIQQIEACNQAVKSAVDIGRGLQQAGIGPMDDPVVNKLNSITAWCGNLDTANVEKIEKQMTATMGVNIAGAAIGTAGVAVSATANSDKVRAGDANKEKALNTTANVLSGANIATGIVGTGLSISLIGIAKNMIKQSERCEEVLK